MFVDMWSYGASITLYVYAAQRPGATRGQIMFTATPFFGLLLSAVVLRDAGFVDNERADFTLSGGRSLMTARKHG